MSDKCCTKYKLHQVWIKLKATVFMMVLLERFVSQVIYTITQFFFIFLLKTDINSLLTLILSAYEPNSCFWWPIYWRKLFQSLRQCVYILGHHLLSYSPIVTSTSTVKYVNHWWDHTTETYRELSPMLEKIIKIMKINSTK